MKKLIIAAVVAFVVTTPAHAISSKYRAQLEHSGCTQVDDAAGKCGYQYKKERSEAIDFFQTYIVGSSINDTADVLLAAGWLPYNGVWSKGHIIMHLALSGSVVKAYIIE